MSKGAGNIVVKWQGKRVTADMKKAALQGVKDAAEFILDEANKGVPHDTGALMRSGTVTTDDRLLAAAVSYDTPYAVRLHENPQYRFQKGRRGKWLERALQENQAAIEKYIADQIKGAQGGS